MADAAIIAPAATVGRSPGRRAGLRRAGSLLLSALILALLWEGATRVFKISPFYLPPLSVVIETIAEYTGDFLAAALRTLTETLIGYVAGILVGVASGALFFQLRLLRELFFPLFIVSQTIPVIAFGAIIVMVFGNTLAAKAIIAFYLTFFPVTVNTLAGLSTVKHDQVAVLRSFGASGPQLFWKLRLPAALPQIFVALRLASTLALIGAIVGEWFGDTVGLGVTLLNAMSNENVPVLWAAILCSALVGSGLYGLVAAIERAVVFWKEEM
jgi:NitT/TauT family transport system permease protein